MKCFYKISDSILQYLFAADSEIDAAWVHVQVLLSSLQQRNQFLLSQPYC